MALLLVDVINAMDFPGGRALARHAKPAARRIQALKQRAKAARVPVIYANDNYGQWRSDFKATIEQALAPDKPGSEIASLLAPSDDDYFVLKPKHSAFYGSVLELLLSYLGCECLVIAGFAGNFCVQFTAQDAFLRDIEVVVARDCVASETPRANRAALELMRTQLDASIVDASRVSFAALRRR
ncbi:MAG: isochorismatase family cysteine hydrolase [Kofleriaceae bacterium]